MNCSSSRDARLPSIAPARRKILFFSVTYLPPSSDYPVAVLRSIQNADRAYFSAMVHFFNEVVLNQNNGEQIWMAEWMKCFGLSRFFLSRCMLFYTFVPDQAHFRLDAGNCFDCSCGGATRLL